MSALQLAEPRTLTEEPPRLVAVPQVTPPRRLPAVAVMLLGLASVAAAAFLAVDRGADARPAPVSEDVSTGTAAFLSTVDIAMADLRYDAGQSSGWHVHPGLHAVVVLTGTLTIYDQDCQRVDYGPGQTHLGGAQPHMVRNETLEPVQLVATRIHDRSSAMGPGMSVAPPVGCDAR